MKYSKIIFVSGIVFTFLAFSPLTQAYSKKVSKEPTLNEVRSTLALKKYMGEFGTLVAGMEIMRSKEKKPDWEAIEITLTQMNKTLQELKQADKAGNYKEFTGDLEKNLNIVQAYGKSKDKRVYEAFDQLTATCFKCHAAHRPSDFLIPKQKEPRISQVGFQPLFNR